MFNDHHLEMLKLKSICVTLETKHSKKCSTDISICSGVIPCSRGGGGGGDSNGQIDWKRSILKLFFSIILYMSRIFDKHIILWQIKQYYTIFTGAHFEMKHEI